MTKNYIKPELEMISVYSEGVLAVSLDLGESTGEDFDILTGINPF